MRLFNSPVQRKASSKFPCCSSSRIRRRRESRLTIDGLEFKRLETVKSLFRRVLFANTEIRKTQIGEDTLQSRFQPARDSVDREWDALGVKSDDCFEDAFEFEKIENAGRAENNA